MGIKLMWTAQGMILANVVAEDSTKVELENPVYVILGPQGAQMMPILGLTEEEVLPIRKSELLYNAALIDPVTELRNHYSQSYGSGIQLLTE